MVKNSAETTIPVAMADSPVAAVEERTREEDRYLSPAVDIYESEDGLTVVADIPGVSAEDLSIRVENGVLNLQAKGSQATNGQEASYLWREYRLTNFWRQFQLPDEVDQEKIKAELKNGVLTLFLPKAESVKPKLIDVKIS